MGYRFATHNKALSMEVNLDGYMLSYLAEGLDLQMGTNIQEQVSEHRAAALLGLSMTEIRRFSRLSGLGHLEQGDRGEQVVFTYEELRRLCLLAAQSSK
jgi:tryptophanyl-tRNA synthetase